MHPLDRPVWTALATGWACVAEGDARARRVRADIGPFAAPADTAPESLAALAALIPGGGSIRLMERGPIPTPPGATMLDRAACVQMIADGAPPPAPAFAFQLLSDADALAMRALAALTEPGPFHHATHTIGRYVGVRREGALVAMAGQRMHAERFIEVSGVCTHPDARGEGLAGGLMRAVMRRIVDEGGVPFLHAYASNAAAIALYERLGFRLRAPMTTTVLGQS